MAAILRMDEIAEALEMLGHPQAADITTAMETLGTIAARMLADALNCEAGSATQEGAALSGICAPFWAGEEGQPFPEILARFDDGAAEEWAPKGEVN